MEHCISEFRTPSGYYRSKPFWSLNGDLRQETLIKQMREMKNMGIAGALFHSRSGLTTRYLDDPWFDLLNAVCKEAEKLDFEIWIYDEDRWPSGTAGGLATKNPEYRQKRLVMEIHPAGNFCWKRKYLAAFSVRRKKNFITSYTRIKKETCPIRDPEILTFHMITMPCTDWYNGSAYLDTLNPKAVQSFIKTTHEQYALHCGNYFGRVIKGIFTDEPHHESVLEPTIFAVQNNSQNQDGYEIPWTESLPDFFMTQTGYDICDHLPAVFFDIDGTEANRCRHDYHNCITAMFVQAYAKQISDWANRHSLLTTGHIFWESPLSKMASYVGSVMRYMENVHIPGVDILSTTAVFTDGRDEYESVKQCTSIASQLGKPQVLSELYACCGWEFTPEEMQRIGDWQLTLGINYRCQSCFAYTLSDCGKRDFPPSYFHVPWKEMMPGIEDYYARANAFISQGRPIRNILIIHPNETMWQAIKVGWKETERFREIETAHTQLTDWLLQSQIDFDFGDEDILSRYGSIETDNSVPVLKLGKSVYTCILIPDLLTIRTSTLKLLRNFASLGGTVIFTGTVPTYLDGIKSPEASVLAADCIQIPHSQQTVLEKVKEFQEIRIDCAPEARKKILCTVKKDSNSYYIIVHNTDTQNGICDVSISFPHIESPFTIQEALPFTGQIKPISSEKLDNRNCLKINLKPADLRLFITTPIRTELHDYAETSVSTQESTYQEEIRTLDPEKICIGNNICMLDFATYRIDESPWKTDYLSNADIDIRQYMSWEQRRFNMLQPWADPEWTGEKSIPVTVRYIVAIQKIPAELTLAMEHPHRFHITVNGHAVREQPAGILIDDSIEIIPINRKYLIPGINVVEMKIDYHKCDGLENIYLLGDFDVNISDGYSSISSSVNHRNYCDLTRNGKPFYYGSVSYNYNLHFTLSDIRKVILQLKKWEGSACKIIVNDQMAGYITSKPHELNITSFLKNEGNRLEIVLMSTSRNIFGPFHCTKPFRGKGWTDPRDYTDPKWSEQNTYNLIPFGLLDTPILSITTDRS